MANISMLWRKPTDSGVYSQGSWSTTLPLENVAEEDVQRVARSTSADVGHTKFRVDLDAVMPAAISDFVVINHNLTTSAKIRFVVTTDASDADAGARSLDTGELTVWVPTVIPGALPWGVWPWGGVDPEAYPSGTEFFHRSGQIGVGRYVWVYINDPANPAGYVQLGRFMAGAAWAPQTNFSFGGAIRWIDPGTARRTRGGKRLFTARPRYRQFEVAFDYLTKEEAFGSAFEIDRQLGKGGNFYLSFDVAEGGGFRFRRSLYAALVDTAPIVERDYDIWTWKITAEDLI